MHKVLKQLSFELLIGYLYRVGHLLFIMGIGTAVDHVGNGRLLWKGRGRKEVGGVCAVKGNDSIVL